jgi:stage VI sporulation protein D
MSEAAEGIRLDLFERVQLSHSHASIVSLEEIELIPHIQVQKEQNQAKLHGHLLLKGTYLSDEGDTNVHQLEQMIPVEITIPMSRVGQVESVHVQVEHFDVEISHPRTLHVTGVLTMHGIQLLQQHHEFIQDEAQMGPIEIASEHHPHPIPKPIPVAPVIPEPVPHHEPPAIPIPIPVPIPTPAPVQHQEPRVIPVPIPAPIQEPCPQPEPIAVEYKRQLIHIEHEQRPFHTIRCCIVQKTDTWTDICGRYNKTMREIRVWNELKEEEELCVGQILIIPN